jgi:hypothetical protein
MATLYTVMKAIQKQVSAVTTGLYSYSPDTSGKPLTVRVGLYWPASKVLQDDVRRSHQNTPGPTAIVAIVDRGLAANSTRWVPTVVSDTPIPTTMTAQLSAPAIGPGGTATVTINGPVSVGDAVALVVGSVPFNCAVIPSAVLGDTPTTIAASMAAMVNGNLDLGTNQIASLLSATSSGPVVTLTSLSHTASLALAVNVGNGGTRLTEIGRRRRHFQIVLWTRTPDDRILVGDRIETLIAGLESDFGLTFPDGTMGRLEFTGDTQHDEATLSDTMRRDFMVAVDYGLTTTDRTYAVLANIIQLSTL